LTRRQRRALALLALINLFVLGVLILYLAQTPSYEASPTTSPLAPARLDACRQLVSSALLEAGQTGAVQVQDHTVLIKLQLPLTATRNIRLAADAATWAALEVMAIAGRGDCLGLQNLQVDVALLAPGADPLHATSRVALADVLLWSLAEIDDAELARRLDYAPPRPTEQLP
jgi:hypothetical protein